MDKNLLKTTAQALVAKGKGILAADESISTCNARFKKVGIPETEEVRRDWRELLLAAPGIEQYVSGVILCDDTIRQSTASGIPFSKLLSDKEILPGIKVDKGAIPFPGHPGELFTEGLDGLRQRFAEYATLGARFSKWRIVVTFDTAHNIPSETVMRANAVGLAMYALLAQEAGIVPLVEPEVLHDALMFPGQIATHSIETAEAASARMLTILFEELNRYGVYLPGAILKTSMVVPGKDSGVPIDTNETAKRTSELLKNIVPKDLGGVVFLSGGQSSDDSVKNLNAIAKLGPYPWGLTYSFGRGIQQPALDYWKGEAGNIEGSRALYLARLKESSDASVGMYSPEV